LSGASYDRIWCALVALIELVFVPVLVPQAVKTAANSSTGALSSRRVQRRRVAETAGCW
jgi:hypothetical protein